MKPRICLIEDDAIMGESLAERFRIEGLHCDWYRTGATATRALRDRSFDLVLSDMRLGDMQGDEIFAWAQASLQTPPPFVFITGYGTVDQAVALIKQGARDYLTKPFDLENLICKIHQWATAPAGHPASCCLGISPAMQAIATALPRIAQSATSVLVVGESGVGKERVARALHAARPDPEGRPFVAVNCGAITESLLEAELFGYEKGAFTGATRTRPGVFEQAHHGTLFLDEIGEMPLSMQVKLLRVLQEREVVRVGSERTIPVDILLICATHRDLRRLVAEGSFREDLYYRINVLQIKVPPLRERPEDIGPLAEGFLRDLAEQHGESPRRIHPAADDALRTYPWPGNVRELRHAIERALILSTAPLLPAAVLLPETFGEGTPVAGSADLPPGATLSDYLRDCERRYIQSALNDNQQQIAITADRLGISRKNLWEKMRKLGIDASTGGT